MRWARILTGLAAPAAALALMGMGQVAGPIEVGPDWGTGNPQANTATLNARIVNNGPVPDRLIRIDCPAYGQAALLNGVVRQVDGIQQNGLDIPPNLQAGPQPVQAAISLTSAQMPVTPGSLVSCALSFARTGQRMVVFTIGAPSQPVAEP